jgi:hypothetical protein
MKKIEDLFKSALKDQELPYNESAWNEMSKKLDARSGGASGNLKWILGAAGAVVVTVGTLIYVNSNNVSNIQENKEKNIASLETKSIKNTNDIDSDEIISENQVQEDNTTEKSNNEVQVKSKTISNETNQQEVVQIIDCCDEKIVQLIPPVYRETTVKEETLIENPGVKEILTFNTLTDKCLNDEFVYLNENKQSLWLNTPMNTLIEIPASSKFKESLNEKGLYQVGELNASMEFVSRSSFTVFEAKSNQLIVEDHLNYENGLPQLDAKAYNEGDNKWYLNNDAVSFNKESNSFNLFKKGNYRIGISTKDPNGCVSQSNVSFYVEEDYNLLAVNAFTPTSWDSRNTHFIPFALTQRNTPFKMIIIDPADGAILFETASAELPWDGTDRNTGKMVEQNKSFVWKVILERPESNEKPEYIGTVVRL